MAESRTSSASLASRSRSPKAERAAWITNSGHRICRCGYPAQLREEFVVVWLRGLLLAAHDASVPRLGPPESAAGQAPYL